MEKHSSGPNPANRPATTRPDSPTAAPDVTASPPAADPKSTQAFQGQTTPDAAGPRAPAAPASAKQKLTHLGDFRLIHKLGEGGMGAVFKAVQISLDREAAVKVLHKHLAIDPAFVQRFLREARIMARLEHPNTVRCLFVGEEHGFHFFAMEFVDGGSLESWVKKLGRLEVGDALHVILACARALQEAHEQGVIHRDMKPDNVLLTRKGVIKVADLGLAKATTEDVSLTRTGTGAGTPVYMAPEQFRDVKHVDPRSDIYSLGCMLYYFLTGNPPFQGSTYVELLEAKEKGQYPQVRRINDAVPPRLDLMVDKLLAKAPEVRYQSCAELIADLEGLGLASTTLSFLEHEGGAPSAAPGAAAKGRPRPPAAPPRGAPPPVKAPARKAPAPPPAPEPEEAAFWYLRYTSSEGRVVTRKMTTSQVREFIRSPLFDQHTQASRTLQGGYRDLGTYHEFANVVQGTLGKVRADRKTATFRELYQNIDKEEATRQRRRWWRHLFLTVGGWVKLLIYLAILGAVGVGIYFGAVWVIHYLSTKGEDFKNYERPADTRLEPKGGR